MFKILKHLDSKYKKMIVLVYFIVTIWVAINTSQWFFIGMLSERFFEIQSSTNPLSYEQSVGYALKVFGILIAFNISGFSMKFFTRSYSAKIGVNLSFKVRNYLYSQFLIMKEQDINDMHTSSLMNRLTNDLNDLQTFSVNFFTLGYDRVAYFIFSLIYSLILSPLLCLMYPIIMVFIIVFGLLADKKSYKHYYQSNINLDETNNVVKENILGNKIVRSCILVDKQTNRFNKWNDGWYKSIIKGEMLIYTVFTLVLFVVNCLALFLIFIGGIVNYNNYFISKEPTITIGIVVAFMNYLWDIIFAITGMLEIYTSFVKVKPILNRIKEIENANKECNSKDKLTLAFEKIKFENVSFKYKNDNSYVLENINVEFEKNKIYGLIGPTGSGKTTLIDLICNFYSPSIGKIYFNNKNYLDLNDECIRKNISIAFQEKLIYEGTFKENILIGKSDATEIEIEKALKQSQAYEFISKKEKQLLDYVSEKGNNLSGGQKQRLSIARAFIKDAEILILDDSLSALDNLTRDKIINTLKKDFKDKTIIISGQQIKTVSFADKILVFEKGKIISSGTHNNLLKNCNLYKNIYESQKSIGE